MLVSTWNRCCVVLFLVASVKTGASQASEARPKANSIKPGVLEETPLAAVNRSAPVTKKHKSHPQQVYPCSNDKECSVGSYCHSPQQASSRCLACRRRKKRCQRDAMCCPGNRCSNSLDDHSTTSTKDQSWRRKGKAQAKHTPKGHEGDPCLRSSDCSDGYCCARHFWTKICKPVLRLGEVCTKQRKKGSHGLEIFQRCDCAKGLSCKVWKDATSSSKSRLHMCQKI
ncbi:dickkopf-related protein 2 isoform X3 [Austrofundulus limnaeus]|uniref:Dickkopf-related protein 2 isoform X3 n=1 Tax=Austrofundulus limnaeus TaxID=52670 RepID=A0A2I4B646_AUSLI|nr:PREDICTED: dickkopf-related protein 2 isoform X3 [Austrofundulus limnaeus]